MREAVYFKDLYNGKAFYGLSHHLELF